MTKISVQWLDIRFDFGKKKRAFFSDCFWGAQDEEPREKGGEKGKGGKGKGRGKGSKGKDVTWPIGPVGFCGGLFFSGDVPVKLFYAGVPPR